METKKRGGIIFSFPILRYEQGKVYLSKVKHSQEESRLYLLGKTDSERFLFVVFTIRDNRIRIISARDMNKKERVVYNEQA